MFVVKDEESHSVIDNPSTLQGLRSGTNYSVTVYSLSSGIRSKSSKPGYFVTGALLAWLFANNGRTMPTLQFKKKFVLQPPALRIYKSSKWGTSLSPLSGRQWQVQVCEESKIVAISNAALAGAAKYVLSVRDVDENVTSVHDDVTATRFKISDLTPSKKYQFRAYTIGRTGLTSSLSRRVSAYTGE